MSKTHIAEPGSTKTLCGRKIKPGHANLAWDTCKTCVRASIARGPARFHYSVDSDGQIINLPTPVYTTNYGGNTTANSSTTVRLSATFWVNGNAA